MLGGGRGRQLPDCDCSNPRATTDKAFGRDHEVLFYAWCDEQASQLRCSLVSASHGVLPFGSPILETSNPEEVARLLLENPHHGGTPLSEFTGVPAGKEYEMVRSPLVVWVRKLP
jgi:hypothetical protein